MFTVRQITLWYCTLLSFLFYVALSAPVNDPASPYIRNYEFRFINSVENSTINFCWGDLRLFTSVYGQINVDWDFTALNNQINYTYISSQSDKIQAYYDNTCNTTLAAEIYFDEIGETGYYTLSFIGSIGNASIQALQSNFSPPPNNQLWKYRIVNQITCNNSLIDIHNVSIDFLNTDYPILTLDLPAAKPNRTIMPYFVSPSRLEINFTIPGYSSFSYNPITPYNQVGMIILFGNCSKILAITINENSRSCNTNTNNDNSSNDQGNDHKIVIYVMLCLGWLLAIVFVVLWLLKYRETSRKNEVGMQRINDQ